MPRQGSVGPSGRSALDPAMLALVKTHRLRLALVALAVLSAWLLAACAGAPPAGPSFTAAPEPGLGRARLYVFRIDPQHSLSKVEIAIDEQPEGRLRNGEYASFELAAGSHRLDFRQRGLAFASWGWNSQQIRAVAGETTYLEISVRMSAQPTAGSGRDLEIPGRDSGSASENVFIQHRSESAAREALAGTTLRVP